VSERTDICRKCGKRILLKHWEMHEQLHAEGSPALKVNKVKVSNPLAVAPDFHELDRFAEPRQPNLDHTKNFGYFYREGPQYGSSSSYDGFDDESKI
jgi:hypothetical protein